MDVKTGKFCLIHVNPSPSNHFGYCWNTQSGWEYQYQNLRVFLKFFTALTQKKPRVYSLGSYELLCVQHYSTLWSCALKTLQVFFFLIFSSRKLVLEMSTLLLAPVWICMFVFPIYLGLRNLSEKSHPWSHRLRIKPERWTDPQNIKVAMSWNQNAFFFLSFVMVLFEHKFIEKQDRCLGFKKMAVFLEDELSSIYRYTVGSLKSQFSICMWDCIPG